MEPEQVFVAIPSTPIQSPPTRKKPGRKPLGLSAEDRVRMNREAQRLSRERKNKRLAAAEEENEALRLRVQQLEAQLTSHSEPTSAYCRNCEFNHTELNA
ncbi:hypothetical protein BCR33DRAFT_338520 [Rhizoclosmatium globosum]|uniref:BZIP domain-containing protein n=1 Tax=Rhizoclosmatium globosum TaxID=329046 RepID=A0A1Y2C3W5_9FUNG|nr:hypothetical protein BCR33DRAFT_338520 [Rhizoclosmatium globosum]|eukprot:ORY41728.1 hypothetical protein BCR33DRAFT_338520 [Rhizoclosmatium globosum]